MDLLHALATDFAAKVFGVVVIGAIVAVLFALRSIGRLRISRTVSTADDIEEILDSDEGLGPAFRLRGPVPVRISTVASRADHEDAGLANATRDESWVISVEGMAVPPGRSFTVTKKALFKSASPDYGSARVPLDAQFDKAFETKVRNIESADLLTPEVRAAVKEFLSRARLSSVELDETRTLRVSLPRNPLSGLNRAAAVARLLVDLARALGGITADARARTQTLDGSTRASNPGGITLSLELLRALDPDLLRTTLLDHLLPERKQHKKLMLAHIREHLELGDARAAIVMSVEPLVIAAYSDDLDCVVHLEFPRGFRSPKPFTVGQRTLTVNTYARIADGVAPDLILGPHNSRSFGNYAPYIASLLSRDDDKIASRIAKIHEKEWQRCAELAATTFIKRDGRPSYCESPNTL